LPGLDGVRAIAVLAVLLYHLDLQGFFSAGFLGVDLFFVLSGFLITSQLLREYQRDQAISLRDFYLRRARRLFPAVVALLLLCVLLVEWFAPDSIRRTRLDALPAFFYASNWWQVFSEQSYFEISGRPPLLQHLWSLAIEEQFYIFWPLALIAILRYGQRLRLHWFALGLMLLSGGWMILLSIQRGFPEAVDPSRAYLGTDTHAFGLFAGAALAALWDPRASRIAQSQSAVGESPWGQAPATRIDWLGMAALAILLAAMLLSGESSLWLYRGGFVLFALVTAVLLFAATQPTGSLPRWLSQPPLVWLGKRSYALYLWHWPIYVLLRPDFELPDHPLLQAVVRLVLTGIAAELSYRYVEQPIRSGELFEWAKQRRHAYLGYVSTGSALLAAVLVMVLVRPAPPPVLGIEPVVLEQDHAGERSMDQPVQVRPYRTLRAACGRSVSTASGSLPPQLTVIGDSVLLGASEHLLRRIDGVEIDAAVGRQIRGGLVRVLDLKSHKVLANTVVIHLGTNGFLGERSLRDVLSHLRDRKVILINVKAPRRWEGPNNAVLAQISSEYSNVKVIDWNAISRRRNDYFAPDRVHLSGKGIQTLSAEIMRAAGVRHVSGKASNGLRVIPCRY
jgi:peptidoglycan/LPS O-acetylase OafA/YrhL